MSEHVVDHMARFLFGNNETTREDRAQAFWLNHDIEPFNTPWKIMEEFADSEAEAQATSAVAAERERMFDLFKSPFDGEGCWSDSHIVIAFRERFKEEFASELRGGSR